MDWDRPFIKTVARFEVADLDVKNHSLEDVFMQYMQKSR